MKIRITNSMKNFLENHTDFSWPYDGEDISISFSELKGYWLQYKKNSGSAFCLFELLHGSELSWEQFYPQKNTKTEEQRKAYEIRLQKLEYDQLTKEMERKSSNFLKDSHKKELSTVINCLLTVIGIFVSFYALTSTIGCQPVTCICSGLFAALVIATIELYYLLRTL